MDAEARDVAEYAEGSESVTSEYGNPADAYNPAFISVKKQIIYTAYRELIFSCFFLSAFLIFRLYLLQNTWLILCGNIHSYRKTVKHWILRTVVE